VRHDQDHVVLGVQEGLQGAVPPGLVTEHDDPHGVPPRSREWPWSVKQGLPKWSTGPVRACVDDPPAPGCPFCLWTPSRDELSLT
jgi:hypothetical protein